MNSEENKINELIAQAAEGNTSAFKDIVRIYRKYVYVLSFRILADEDDAKDVAQDSFIRVWKHLADYDKKIKFSTWLYKIVVNLSYDKLKYRKRKMKIIVNENNLRNENLYEKISEDKDYSNTELAALIEKLAGGLPEKQRIIFTLRDLQELSIEVVAQLTGMSVSSVKTNLVYARRSIRNKLEKSFGIKDWK